MDVIYNNKSIKNNDYLKITETQKQPDIKIHKNNNNYDNNIYTIIMYDPDAINGTYIHWIITNILRNDLKTGNVILNYKGPSPPPKTGKHRYIFELYNEIGEKIINDIERNMSIDNLKSILSLDKPLYKIQFISENKIGGKKRKTYRNSKRKIKRKYTIKNIHK
jgi:phosphatidylethanolamine-binding protein (PEBP) family uncharacterized protein